jgi:excisionase family DNA binding protein
MMRRWKYVDALQSIRKDFRQMDSASIGTGERLALSIMEAAQAVGISRAKLYTEIKTGSLATLRIGGRRVVRVVDLNSWLQRHAA